MAKKKGPGRPRKNQNQLARWKPPEGWVRVVAWVSPEERKALKRVAIDAETSVAELIRSLASGLVHDVISADELLKQVRKGVAVMEKIPTIFDRGENFRVIDKVREGCEWVFEGDGAATEKLDGTNIRMTIRRGTVVRVEKRRNPTKIQKKKGIIDGWYVDADEAGREDRWIYAAVNNTDVSAWPDGEHPCEALGPKIQGNELGLETHLCVPFNLEIPVYDLEDRSYGSLKAFLADMDSQYAPRTPGGGNRVPPSGRPSREDQTQGLRIPLGVARGPSANAEVACTIGVDKSAQRAEQRVALRFGLCGALPEVRTSRGAVEVEAAFGLARSVSYREPDDRVGAVGSGRCQRGRSLAP